MMYNEANILMKKEVSLWLIVDDIKTIFAETPSNIQKIRELLTEHDIEKRQISRIGN